MLNHDYRINELVASGYSTDIYSATNVRIESPVAIKVLRPEFLLNKFAREIAAATNSMRLEAEVMVRIDHPNVLKVYEFASGDGFPYVVMEFLDCDNMETVLMRDGPLAHPRFLQLFNQLCDAMNAVHEKGIVHRDLKPANFLIARSSEPLLKLTGFKICQSNDAKSGRQTLEGELVGTPPYMSPEQCLASKPVDNRSDIYSLGCCMYEALTGSLPFIGSTMFDTMTKHLAERPQPFVDQNSAFAKVQAVVLRCLEKDAADRFQSMQQVQRALVGVPVKIKPSAALRGLENDKELQ